MENWKIECQDDAILTAGDYGRINFYDSTSKERTKKTELGDIFLTALAKSNQKGFIAAGNNNGDVFVLNSSGNKDKVLSLKPHSKIVRQVRFIEEDSKVLSASDDGSVRMIDISS